MCAGQEALGTLCTFLSIPKTTLKNKVIKKKEEEATLSTTTDHHLLQYHFFWPCD